jgi:hypothetical protein
MKRSFHVMVFAASLLSMSAISVFAAKPTCAVLTFDAKGGVSRDEAFLLSDRFAIELDKTGVYTLTPRGKQAEVLQEQKFSRSDNCSATDCAIEAGKLLGAQFMVYGSVGKIGSVYTVNVYLINVESGVSEKSATVDQRGVVEDLLMIGMAESTRRLILGSISKVFNEEGKTPIEPSVRNPRAFRPVTFPQTDFVGDRDRQDAHKVIGEEMSEPDWSASAPLQLAICYPVQMCRSDTDIRGLRLTGIFSLNRNVSGVDMSYFFTGTTGNFSGFQFSMANYVGGDFIGIQGVVVNYVGGEFLGFQCGYINIAHDMKGLQLGLVNYAGAMRGVQIGFINIIKESPMPFFPVVNAYF